MTTFQPPKAPAKLGKAGRAMWRKLATVFEFTEPHELYALQRAAELEDDIVRLREALTDADLVVPGSYKQPVESPLLGSIRQATALQSKLLLTITTDEEQTAVDRSSIGRRNAMKRWYATRG